MQDVGKFLKKHWERKPAIFRASESSKRAALIQGAMSFDHLCALLDELEEVGEYLLFERDIQAMCCKRGKRKNMHPSATDASHASSEVDMIVDRGTAESLFAKGATLQVSDS